MDEIGFQAEQCKPAAAWRAINRLSGRKFKPLNRFCAASIADRKRQLTNHYSAILNGQHNQQQQQYRLHKVVIEMKLLYYIYYIQ